MPRHALDPQIKSAKKLRQVVYEEIRREIITCELEPGVPLSESYFAEKLKISKTPVREALTSLQQYHLVEYTPNRGFNVTAITLKDIQEIFEARHFYEATLFQLALRHITDMEIVKLENLCGQNWDKNDPTSITRYIDINLDFHMTIAAASRNQRLIHHYGNVMDEAQRLIYMDLLNNPLQMFWNVGHRELVDAVKNRDEENGSRVIDEMLISGKNRILGLERYS